MRAKSVNLANDAARMSMMKPASQAAWQDGAPADVAGREERIAPAPRISVQAFCETVETAGRHSGRRRRSAHG